MKKQALLISAMTVLGGWQLALAQPPSGGGGFTPPSFDGLNTETEETPNHLTQEEVTAFFQQRFANFGGGGGPGAGGPGGGAGGAGAAGPGAGGPGGGFGPAGMFSRWDTDGDGLVSREEFDNRQRGGFGGGPRGAGGQPQQQE